MEVLNRVKDYLTRNYITVISLLLAIGSVSFSFIYVSNHQCAECEECREEKSDIEIVNEEVENVENITVDIKGAVKKPGVYELAKGSVVNDAIKSAGGLLSSAVTNNINLSKKLSDEMVIYVFNKTEIKTKETKNEVVCEVPKCECEEVIYKIDDYKEAINEKSEEKTTGNIDVSTNSTTDSSDEKISINSDSVEELTKLEGIGESKAKAIIEYRKEFGNFKAIEDIKKVSGIGDKAYEKIKDNIKI